jgi:hypothetical protein
MNSSDLVLHLIGEEKALRAEITLNLLDEYCEIYRKQTNGSKITKPSNIRYARKLAAKNLLNYRRSNSIKVKDGFCYLITNPVFPDWAKLGKSVDPLDRLNTFNTADPNRAFKLEAWAFYSDVLKKEGELHKLFPERKNEWICISKAGGLSKLIELLTKNSILY